MRLIETNASRQNNYSSFVKELINDETFHKSRVEDKNKTRILLQKKAEIIFNKFEKILSRPQVVE